MSSLRSQSPLEYPHTVLPSHSAQSEVLYLRKRNRSLVVLLCPSHVLPKRPCMAATPGFKSQHQSSSDAPFLTPPTIGHSCQHSHIFPALLGCCSKSRQVWPCSVETTISKLSRRLCNQGDLPPSYILGGSHSHPLAQSIATAI